MGGRTVQHIKRILVPVDLSPCSRSALEYALFLADRLEVEPPEIIVLHAWLTHAWEPPPVGLPWVRPGHAEMAAEKAVEMFVAELDAPPEIPIRLHLEHGHACRRHHRPRQGVRPHRHGDAWTHRAPPPPARQRRREDCPACAVSGGDGARAVPAAGDAADHGTHPTARSGRMKDLVRQTNVQHRWTLSEARLTFGPPGTTSGSRRS